jgi:hypothetical protein
MAKYNQFTVYLLPPCIVLYRLIKKVITATIVPVIVQAARINAKASFREINVDVNAAVARSLEIAASFIAV